MKKPDEGHALTDKELEKLERRIASVYQQASDELKETIDAYFASFARRDAKMKSLIGTKLNGQIWTEEDYKLWRLAQIGRGERFNALRDKIAQRMTEANEVAIAYSNDATPGIYSLNRNYAAYTIEQQVGYDVGFDIWDEQTVKRLIVEEPDLMPYYPNERALKRGIDIAYGKKQITASVTSGILQGKSIKGLADDLQTRIPTMNRDSAIRTARTAVTGAQSAGRMDSYAAAKEMGIKIKGRMWLATLDNRTRHAHRILDGKIAKDGEPFRVDGKEIMFPGDPNASGDLVYNCRCRLMADVDVSQPPNMLRRARDPITGENVVISDMTYAQWESWKSSENRYEWDIYQKKGANYSADQKQYAEYKALLGRKAPSSFRSFQDLKYKDPDALEELKLEARKKRADKNGN